MIKKQSKVISVRVNICNKLLFADAIQRLFPGFNLPKINGLTIDSRNVEQGDIFLPLKGNKFDGHQFIMGLASHFRDLLVCKNPVTVILLDKGEELQKK